MSITTTRSVIDIGTSQGITLPAKELKALGIKKGDKVKAVIYPVLKEEDDQLAREYAEFVKQYGETLKNLSQR